VTSVGGAIARRTAITRSTTHYFFALDAMTGQLLLRFQTGGEIWANPIAFTVDGRQHIAIAAGHGIFAFAVEISRLQSVSADSRRWSSSAEERRRVSSADDPRRAQMRSARSA
jgi:hypothetical protein